MNIRVRWDFSGMPELILELLKTGIISLLLWNELPGFSWLHVFTVFVVLQVSQARLTTR